MTPDEPSLAERVLGDELLSLDQVAKLLDLSRLTVSRMVNRGDLPSVRYARRVRLRASDIRAWVTARTRLVYHGPTDEEREMLELHKTLHEACRCDHVASTLADLLSKGAMGARGPEPEREVEASPKSTEALKDELLTVKQVAEVLHLSPVSIARMLRSGRLPAIKVGGRRLVHAVDLRSLLAP